MYEENTQLRREITIRNRVWRQDIAMKKLRRYPDKGNRAGPHASYSRDREVDKGLCNTGVSGISHE